QLRLRRGGIARFRQKCNVSSPGRITRECDYAFRKGRFLPRLVDPGIARAASGSSDANRATNGALVGANRLLASRVQKNGARTMRYLHNMVRVVDLDRALDFYCAKLGLKEVRRIDN